MSRPSRIAVVGAGEVGSTIAYSLVLNPIVSEILLVDPQEEARDAQVQDLSDASFQGGCSTTHVRAGTHREAGQCDVVVITAGAKQKKGESRTGLIGRNFKILESSIEDMKPLRKDTVLLLVANPVDVLTYFAQKFADLPKEQVFGSGTVLDSARLRGILAQKCGVAASSINAYVLGEHGESQVVAWSHVSVGGIPLKRAMSQSVHIDKDAIAQDTKQKASAIIQSKGSTAYGIGGVVGTICKAVLYDTLEVLPISHYQEDLKVCLSTPVVLGRKGIVRPVKMPLDKAETEALAASAKSLEEVIRDAKTSGHWRRRLAAMGFTMTIIITSMYDPMVWMWLAMSSSSSGRVLALDLFRAFGINGLKNEES